MVSHLVYPEYVGSSDKTKLDQAFERIMKALISNDAEFLFGAGMSASSLVPTGMELLNILLENYFPSSGENRPSSERIKWLTYEFPFEAIVQAFEKKPGKKREDLTQFLTDVFLNSGYESSEAHHDFLSICTWGGSLKLDRIFTTNFDKLIEQVMGPDLSEPITEENAKDIKKVQQKGRIPVIHLHGMLHAKYIITESDIFSQEYRVLKNEFETALHNADAFVFVGYSMNDPDFRRVYMKYREDIKDRKKIDKETYVVCPSRDVFSYILGSEIWSSRGAIWIPLDCDKFFARLKHFIDSHSKKEIRSKVMQKYNLTNEDMLNDYINQTAEILRVGQEEALQFLFEARTRTGGGK